MSGVHVGEGHAFASRLAFASRFFRKKGPWRRLKWSLGGALVAISAVMSCSPGKIELFSNSEDSSTSTASTTEAVSGTGGISQANEEVRPTGGQSNLGSGGEQGQEPVGQGGDTDSSGSTDETSGPDYPDDYPGGDGDTFDPMQIPCLARNDCPPTCEVDPDRCIACVEPSQCEEPVTYCSPNYGSCVECLSNEDCRRRFGPGLADCTWGGVCVPCGGNEDCRPGEFCNQGWCSECRRNFDCEMGEICLDARCVPDFKN